MRFPVCQGGNKYLDEGLSGRTSRYPGSARVWHHLLCDRVTLVPLPGESGGGIGGNDNDLIEPPSQAVLPSLHYWPGMTSGLIDSLYRCQVL